MAETPLVSVAAQSLASVTDRVTVTVLLAPGARSPKVHVNEPVLAPGTVGQESSTPSGLVSVTVHEPAGSVSVRVALRAMPVPMLVSVTV